MSLLSTGFDHLQIVASDPKHYVPLFEAFGFVRICETEKTGDGKSWMQGSVMRRAGGAHIAVLGPIDGEEKSQLTHYIERYGDLVVQHIALPVDDIEAEVERLTALGVKFVSPICKVEDESGTLFQCFSYPLAPGGKIFIELVQRVVVNPTAIPLHKKPAAITYAYPNVEVLYSSIADAIREGWWFEVDLYGNRSAQ